MTSTLDFIVSL